MFQKLDEVEKRYEEVTRKISDPEIIAQQSQWQALMKEHAEIEPVVLKYKEYKKVNQAIEDAKEMLKDPEALNTSILISAGFISISTSSTSGNTHSNRNGGRMPN